MDLNKAIVIGRLTKELELKVTPSGNQYIQFSLAVGNGKDKEGNERNTDFLNFVAWGKCAENLSVYLHKGNRIAIEGRNKVEMYENEKGEKKYKSYILVEKHEFLESKQKENFVPQEPEQAKETKKADPFESFGNSIEIKEEQDSLPFEDNDLPF